MDTLKPLEYSRQRILTTQQLADGYETDPQIITNNFNRNKERYALGKHYYRLDGEEKRAFLNLTQFDLGSKNAKYLYLWTERGALLHAKSLNTDRAWEMYDHLVETYFRVREQSQPEAKAIETKPFAINLKLLKEYRLLANNKNIPASQKSDLLDLMFKEITGSETPATIEKRYYDFGEDLSRIAWLDIKGVRYMNTGYVYSRVFAYMGLCLHPPAPRLKMAVFGTHGYDIVAENVPYE